MYTIEEVNTLIGTRAHRKASPYLLLEEAKKRADFLAERSKKFGTFNVLDRRGDVVYSAQGKL